MTIRPSPLAMLLSVLALGGCAQGLGAYSVEGVQQVTTMPSNDGREEPGYGRYFRIDLTSAVDLAALRKGDAVYGHADFCPVSEKGGLVTFGPTDEDGRRVPPLDGASRPKPHADGLFRYRVFIVAAHPMPGVKYSSSWDDQQRYDLRSAQRDVCIRFHAPSYSLVQSRSRTVRVPGRFFSDAAMDAGEPGSSR